MNRGQYDKVQNSRAIGYVVMPDGRVLNPRGKEVRPFKTVSGYRAFSIRWCGKNQTVYVRHAQAVNVLGERAVGCEIETIDGNPTNDRLSNLRFHSKLCRRSRAQFLRAQGRTYRQIAEALGLSPSSVPWVWRMVAGIR